MMWSKQCVRRQGELEAQTSTGIVTIWQAEEDECGVRDGGGGGRRGGGQQEEQEQEQ